MPIIAWYYERWDFDRWINTDADLKAALELAKHYDIRALPGLLECKNYAPDVVRVHVVAISLLENLTEETAGILNAEHRKMFAERMDLYVMWAHDMRRLDAEPITKAGPRERERQLDGWEAKLKAKILQRTNTIPEPELHALSLAGTPAEIPAIDLLLRLPDDTEDFVHVKRLAADCIAAIRAREQGASLLRPADAPFDNLLRPARTALPADTEQLLRPTAREGDDA